MSKIFSLDSSEQYIKIHCIQPHIHYIQPIKFKEARKQFNI